MERYPTGRLWSEVVEIRVAALGKSKWMITRAITVTAAAARNQGRDSS